jgi:exonuclease III
MSQATVWQLALWNAQRLSSKKLVQGGCLLTDHTPDAFCITETWLHPGKFIDYASYKVFRNDRSGKEGGGVAILLKTGIRPLKVKRSPSGSNVEWLAVLIDQKGKAPIWLVCVYVPSGELDWNSSFIDEFIAEGPTIVCGDFNARHESFGMKPETNRSGKVVADLLYSGRLVLLGGKEATHKKGRRLDLWLCSPDLVNVFGKVKVGDRYGSDHNVLTVKANLAKRTNVLEEIRFNYTKANWPLFVRILEGLLAKLKRPNLVNPAFIRLYDSQIRAAILEAASIAIPKCKAKKIPNWVPSADIRAAVKERHQFERLRQNTGLAVYGMLANQAHERFKALVEAGEGRKVDRKLVQMEKNRHCDVRQFFQVYKQLNSKTGAAPRNGVQPLKASNGDLEATEEGQARVLAIHTAKSLTLRPNDTDTLEVKEHHQRVIEEVEANEVFKPLASAYITDLPEEIRIGWNEFTFAVKRLKLKAPGFDGIQNILIKRGGEYLWAHLLHLFNASLACGYLPEDWKKAIVVPLPRAGKDLSSPGGYRPVSLLLTITKLLESIMAMRLRNLMEKYKLFPRHQSGFRSRRSTNDHLFALSQLACRARLRKLVYLVALLDFEGAFNAVWHDGLRFKLASCEHIPTHFKRWVSSFLESRSFAIRVGSHVGEYHPIEAGVPQGSPLSPILFAFFTADMLPGKGLMNADEATFADDVLLHSLAAAETVAFSRVNQSLRVVHKWSKLWRLPLNPAKCQAMRFGAGQNKLSSKKLFIGENVLEFVSEAKYLGLLFTTDMLWIKQIDSLAERVRPALAAFRAACRKGSPLSLQSRKLLYTATIRPILEYGSAAFLNASATQLQKLIAIEHEAVRRICQVFEYKVDFDVLYRKIGLEPLQARMVRLAANVANKWLRSDDHPTAQIVLDDLKFPGSTPLSAFSRLVKRP